MKSRLLFTSAALVFSAVLFAGTAVAQNQASAPQSPYGGTTVEDIVARVNDQIITNSDYNRALNELEQEGRSRGESMQQMSEERQNLLRNLIDQQLWLSKGKELGITGDTELIKRLDEIRKQYHMASLEDLEKAAKEQGVSFEDFKANIRNQIITQQVMREQVGAKIQLTPGEARRYYEEHAQEYVQPESVRLSEILISTGTPSGSSAPGETAEADPARLAAAKAKADDIEARLNSGGDFAQLARSFSDGPTAASGGDLGQFRRGALAKVLEDATFSLKAGQHTAPIRTRQGYVILNVVQHVPGGVPPYKDVQEQVEESLYMSRMEPAIRAYLTQMRDEAFIDIKSGYVDTGASPNETKPVFSAYVPPAPKKKAKVERTRFRENTRTFRQKSPQSAPPPESIPANTPKKKAKPVEPVTEKPGKKEKIRYGQAPRATLPAATNSSATENAGALPENTANAQEPANPLEAAAPAEKTRFSSRARQPKKHKPSAPPADSLAPAAPDAAEVADRQTQSSPLGLNGNTAAKKKKKQTTTGEKTRMSDEKHNPAPPKPPLQMTPAPQEPGAPAPAPAQPAKQ